MTYYDDDDDGWRVLQPHLVRPGDAWVSYHLPQPAGVTRLHIRALGNRSLALCEVNVLAGESTGISEVLWHLGL